MWDNFLQWLHHKRWQLRLKRLVNKGYLKKGTYEPNKCMYCKSDKLYWDSIDSVGSIALEQLVTCRNCDKVVGHWITGNWDLTFYEP